MASIRQCTSCKIEKSIDDFYMKTKIRKNTICSACENMKRTERRKLDGSAKRYYLKHREIILIKSKQKYNDNKIGGQKLYKDTSGDII